MTNSFSLEGFSLDEELTFADEQHDDVHDLFSGAWRILIVDDEKDVHEATCLALRGLVIQGRPLSFVHAYSAAEARDILYREGDSVAVVLLDVVMEFADAGLRLVEDIRDRMGLKALRIILRTGQPGYAPELETIRAYDINDYKTKSELTRVRLYTSLTVALRSFWQLCQLEASRKGLEKIIEASSDLSRLLGLNSFSEGVVTQICALLNVPAEGIVCANNPGDSLHAARIIAAAGSYASMINQPLSVLPNQRMRNALERSLLNQCSDVNEETCLYFEDNSRRGVAVCIESPKPLDVVDQDLLQVFSANLSVGFNNVALHERLVDVAFNDQLLSIPNRNRFVQLIEERLACPAGLMLALIDIDDFSGINAALDQHFGDRVLAAVCARLAEGGNGETMIGRVAGDCFGLLGEASTLTPSFVAKVFEAPFDIGGEHLRLSATSGFIELDASASSAAELLKDASIALKQAKAFSRGKSMVFSKDLRTTAKERMRLLTGLRGAFSAERLFVVYQPQVDLLSRRIIGAEVLLRWRNEEGQFVPPDRFIPLAEQSGIIIPIGDWVLRTACAKLRELITAGYHDFRMAINVSHIQFREPDFVRQLEVILAESGVPAAQVEIELTESIAPEGLEMIVERISALRALGVTVAMDDFGTGYSSLTMLSRLPIDRIKIDRAFINELALPDRPCNIVEMILALARQLNLVAIAEGVETEEQYQMLVDLGCVEGQGYLFAKPLNEDDFSLLLAAQSALPD